ncbi:MAG: DEAD/DEAH box helicase family protein, partial [Mycoplasmatales bacterium]
MEKIYYRLTRTKQVQMNQTGTAYQMIKGAECLRCGAKNIKEKCVNCQEMGSITTESIFFQLTYLKYPQVKKLEVGLVQLTPLQTRASEWLTNNLFRKKRLLIWAVCGAGKTEITFKAIEEVLCRGEFVAFAIPRIDILYEIAQRLREYFPTIEVAILNSREPKGKSAQIYVMTTNQILNFYNAFSLIIIDEVDAFPYEYNQKFEYGVTHAMRTKASIIYLTSTPSAMIKELVDETFIINRRWHSHDLPVPHFLFLQIFNFSKTRLNPKFVKIIENQPRQLLIFVGKISLGEKLHQYLKHEVSCEFIHANHKFRHEI